jgi:hypothetical protein
MMMPQVMQMMMLLHSHFMVIMMVHARMTLLLQSPSTIPHCFLSQGDTKVSNANMVDYIDSYDELVSRLASMTMSLENEKAKSLKLENENSFLKNSCEEHKHLLYVLKSSHAELNLTHETLLISHEELLEQHASLIRVFTKKT